MGRVVADHGLPFVVDFNFQLNDELDYLPRLCPVVMPDSSVGPYRKCIIGFSALDLASTRSKRSRILFDVSAREQVISASYLQNDQAGNKPANSASCEYANGTIREGKFERENIN